MDAKSDGGLVAVQVRYHGYHLWLATRGAPAIQNALRLRTLKADNIAVEINLTWSRQLPGRPARADPSLVVTALAPGRRDSAGLSTAEVSQGHDSAHLTALRISHQS